MATYSGALGSDGLPELADDGEIDFPAMTLRRALHVTLRDDNGLPVSIPAPVVPDEDNPAHVTQPDGDLFHVKVDNAVRPDLSLFKGGRLPVDTGLVIPPPAPAPVVTPQPRQKRNLEFDEDAVNVSGSTVEVEGTVTARMGKTVGGRPYGVIVSTTPVLLAAANGSRQSILISNNSTGILYVGFDSSVASSGKNMGTPVPTNGSYSDCDPGTYIGALWGVYSAVASSENVIVSDRY